MTNSTQPQPSVLRRFITPPTYPDEDKTRAARLLHTILMIMWVLVVISVIPSVFLANDKLASALIWIALVLPVVIATGLLQRGQVGAASATFIVGAWLLLTGATLPFGGSISPTTNSFILIVIIAGLLLGGRGAVVTAVLNIITLTVLLFLTEAKIIPPPDIPNKPADIWANLCIGIGLAAALLYLTSRSINQALTVARRNAAAQAQSNRELTSIRASLEERIIERTAQLNVSAEVARAVSSILDPDELLRRVTLLIVERFHLYYAAAFLVDDDAEYAVLREATGEAGRVLKERGHKLEITGPSMVGMAIATRQPRIVQDVDAETMRFANPLLTETKSEVALPLIMGDQSIGALDVQSTRAAAFDESTVLVLQGLADQIAIAINNARQYQAAQREARQATVLFEASRLGGFMSEDLAGIAHKLLDSTATESSFDSWLAATYDPEADAMNIIAISHVGLPNAEVPIDQVRQLSENANDPLTLAIQSRESVLITDPERDPRVAHVPPALRKELHLVCAPAMLGNHVIGVISLRRITSQPKISARDVQLAEAMASQFAIAIENRRLLEQSQKSVEEMNRLMRLYMHEGWSNFSQTRTEENLQQEYTRPDAPTLRPEVQAQIDEAVSQAAMTSEGSPISIDGQSVVSVPIELRGEVFGALTIQDTTDRQWTDDELATLQAVAAQVAQSLESARLLQESEVSLQETMGLYQASRGIAAAQTPAEVLESISDSIITPEIDRIVLALVLPDSPKDNLTAEVAAAWERGVETPTVLGNRWAAAQIPLIGPRLVEPLVANDVATATNLDPISRHIFANVIKVKSMAVLPLQSASGLLGWLMIETLRQPYNFGETEIRRYRTLAGQAAVALENRRLFQETQQRAQREQLTREIGTAISKSLDLDTVLKITAREISHALGATHAIIRVGALATQDAAASEASNANHSATS